MKRGWIKKSLIAALVVAILAGAVFGGSAVYRHFHTGNIVGVYSMADQIVTDDWLGDSGESYGNVRTTNIQTVYVSSTQTVTEVLVKDGQEVKKGDVLFTYDSTLNDLNVERQKLMIQKKEAALETLNKELKKYQSYRPGQIIPYAEYPGVGPLLSQAAEPEYTARLSGFGITDAVRWLGTVLLQDVNTGEPTSEENSSRTETVVPESQEAQSQEGESQVPETNAPETNVPKTNAPETQTPETNAPETTVPPETEPDIAIDPDRAYPKRLGGKGTAESPYRYRWEQDYEMDRSFAAYVLNGKENAHVVFEVYQQGDQKSPSFAWAMTFHKDGSYQYGSVRIGQSVYDAMKETKPAPKGDDEKPVDQGQVPGGNEMPFIPDGGGNEMPFIPDDGGMGNGDAGNGGWSGWNGGEDSFQVDSVTLTAEDIAKFVTAKQDEVQKTDLDLRQAKLELEKMEAELNNDKVVSTMDGVVTMVNDLDTASRDASQAFLKVSAGGGYYVTCYAGELDLEDIQVGQKVDVLSYNSGALYEGVIQEISEYPADQMNYYSGNVNVSYYPYKIFIKDDANLENGEAVSVTLQQTQTESKGFYLNSMFIRTENGTSYVYKQGEDGTLVKQKVRTGASLWGSYTQILSGITPDTYLAFPYGSNVKEGAATEEKDINDLMGY